MATNTVFKRLLSVAITATLSLASVRPLTAGDNWLPLLPDQDFYDFQLFAPPDLQEYAIYPDQKDGIFFQYDRLYWSLTPPRNSSVGNDEFWPTELISTAVEQSSQGAKLPVNSFLAFGTSRSSLDLDTSWLMSDMTWGNRYEGGWIYDDYGVLISGFYTAAQSQSLTATNQSSLSTPTQTIRTAPGTVTTPSPSGAVVTQFTQYYIVTTNGPPDHVVNQQFTLTNKTSLAGIESSAMVRRLYSRNSTSSFDFLLGVRFLQVEDRFDISYNNFTTDGDPSTIGVQAPGDILLQNGGWNTLTTNNMVGPQIGLRTSASKGRWGFHAEGRVMAAANFQNTILRGARFPDTTAMDYYRGTTQQVQGPIDSPTAPSSGGALTIQNFLMQQQNTRTAAQYGMQWAPVGEWRLDTTFRVTESIQLRVGYTGMWLSGIARASRKVTYENQQQTFQTVIDGKPAEIVVNYTQMGTQERNASDQMFVNGADFGLEVNF